MPQRTVIVDGTGKNKHTAKVTVNNELLVNHGVALPPYGESQPAVPFIQYLSSDGTASGSTDMQVNGSTTNVDFWVAADPTSDIYLMQASFLISDATPVLNKFGNVNTLTKGCQFFYTSKLTGTQYLSQSLKSNFDFLRMCLFNPPFGGSRDPQTMFQLGDIIGASEGYCPILDFSKLIPPYGIKLDSGSDQRLVLKVRDNISSVDAFNCIIYGFKRLQE